MERTARLYYLWLIEFIDNTHYYPKRNQTYNELLGFLHSFPFKCKISADESRIKDALGLRWRYCDEYGIPYRALEMALPEECSILELMIALTVRCEEEYMDNGDDDPRYGQWFWDMVKSLTLDDMYDGRFNSAVAGNVLYRFNSRLYQANGSGSLFRAYDMYYDYRTMPIWYQLMHYISFAITRGL